ncbi:hypothetical protein ACOMHN_006155 [Nucella lapillus]
MGKFYCGTVTYKWNWDQVAQAFWQRYPNPFSKHVLTEDILSRHVEGHCLYTRRILSKTNPVPRWGERFIPNASRKMFIIEESVVDSKSRTITTYTRNTAMQHVMSVEEKCVYQVSPDNSKWTVCEKSAWVTSAVFGLGTAIQAFGLDRFKKNAVKASRGYEHVLEKLFSPVVHHQQQVHGADKLKDKAIKVAQAAKAKAKAPSAIIPARAQPS